EGGRRKAAAPGLAPSPTRDRRAARGAARGRGSSPSRAATDGPERIPEAGRPDGGALPPAASGLRRTGGEPYGGARRSAPEGHRRDRRAAARRPARRGEPLAEPGAAARW